MKLDAGNAVAPDIVFVSTARMAIIIPRGIEGAPDLVVEVLPPGTAVRDRRVKYQRYAAAGVPHYWIVDPVNETLEPYRLGAEGYVRTGVYGPGDSFSPELFPGLVIAVAAILA